MRNCIRAEVQEMLKFKTLNTGWAKGEVDYGAGLMIINGIPPFAGDHRCQTHHISDTGATHMASV